MRIHALVAWWLISLKVAGCSAAIPRSDERGDNLGRLHRRQPALPSPHDRRTPRPLVLAKRTPVWEAAASQGAPLGATPDGHLHDPRGHPKVDEGRGPRHRRPDTDRATHVSMYSIRWIPYNQNPAHEAVVTELMTCTALIIHVGSRGAVAAHLSPMGGWYQAEIEQAIDLAKEHHREGDRYEIHLCQPDPTRFAPREQNIYGGNRNMREFLMDVVKGELKNPPRGRQPTIHWHYYHMKTDTSTGQYRHSYRNNFHAKLWKPEDAVNHDTRLSRYINERAR